MPGIETAEVSQLDVFAAQAKGLAVGTAQGLAAYLDGLIPVLDPMERMGLYNPAAHGMETMVTLGTGMSMLAGETTVLKGFEVGGWLTKGNQWLRIGWGQHQSHDVFRISGRIVGRFKENAHIDLFWGLRR